MLRAAWRWAFFFLKNFVIFISKREEMGTYYNFPFIIFRLIITKLFNNLVLNEVYFCKYFDELILFYFFCFISK